MEQCWLRPNSRSQLLEAIPWLAFFAIAGGILAWGWLGEIPWLMWSGLGLTIVSLFLLATHIWLSLYPRMSIRDDVLLFYLPAPKPLEVPVDVVECFFIGQGPTMLPGVDERSVQAANVVVRLAEKATEWHHHDVPPLLAHWCDGYIILRGAFCEPVDGDVVNHLNKLLAEVHRQRKKAAAEGAK